MSATVSLALAWCLLSAPADVTDVQHRDGGGDALKDVIWPAQVALQSPNPEWTAYILAKSDSLGLDATRVARIIYTESRWHPGAVNPWSGCTGLMQVCPSVWRGAFPLCGVDLFDPITNLCYGMSVFNWHKERSGGHITLALNSYWGCRPRPEIQRCGSNQSWYSRRTE
jgi:hypothetical protein